MQLDAADGGSQIQRQLRSDLLDLALLWADMKIRLAALACMLAVCACAPTLY